VSDIQDDFISRRSALLATAAAGAAGFLGPGSVQGATESDPNGLKRSVKRYAMKSSINLWAFPYPSRMSLVECLKLAREAGFDGIELNYDLDNDLSPKAGPKEFRAVRKAA
jgi:hexulose-6-phosphate isomerase